MVLPMEGPYDTRKLVFGLILSWINVIIVFQFAVPTGPALLQATAGDPRSLITACSGGILVTLMWNVIYYNYVGVQVLCVFTKMWKMFTDDDITENFAQMGSRFAGNMFDQGPNFLWPFWMYVIFADAGSGWILGCLYIFTRVIYPLYYIINQEFTFWFETCTQIGYGVNGLLMLGSFWSAMGGDWVAFITANPIMAPFLGFMVGSFAMIPGIPLTMPYLMMHYKLNNAKKRNEEKQKLLPGEAQ